MNIYAAKGHKIRCSTLDAGYEYDKKVAKSYLKIGNIYTVEKTSVDNWSTSVSLQEFPGKNFNSVFFEDVESQPEESDKLHPDYYKYNRR